MKVAFYTNIASPHQLPFARELVKRVGVENYRYICSEPFHAERRSMGWTEEQESWILSEIEQRDEACCWLEGADVLIVGHRDLPLIERRCQKGLRTFYAGERWFKPIFISGLQFYIPGWVRMFVPSYFKMVRRFVALTRKYASFRLLPYGVWAERDFRRMGVSADKMTTWGYAVAPAEENKESVMGEGVRSKGGDPLVRILWVGRMIRWKCVDTIIRAVTKANQCQGRKYVLTLVGDGPEKPWLQCLAKRMQKDLPSQVITFRLSCPIGEIRPLMRQHDIYVLASNGEEGWGAVVNEALEEGMLCLGTREAGATATLLPSTCQFDSADVNGLARLLLAGGNDELPHVGIGSWSAVGLAERFMSLIDGQGCGQK